MAKQFKRRPNRSGSVIKLSGNRRKPFGARIFDGYNDETGYIKQKYIGYFETWEDANTALTLYYQEQKGLMSSREVRNLSPEIHNEISRIKLKSSPTFSEIFEILYDTKYCKLTSATVKRSNYKSLKKIHNKRVDTISLKDLQSIFDEFKQKQLSAGTMSWRKSICTDVFKYAIMHQIIERGDDFSEYIDVSTDYKKERKHKPFTINEIKQLFEVNSRSAKIILIYIFTGCRPIELYELTRDRIFIDTECGDDGNNQNVSYIVTGSKTAAGQNRRIPIHNLIKPFIIELLSENKKYLFLEEGYVYDQYKWQYEKIFETCMSELKLTHTPYDTRHTFATLAKLYKLDPYCRKRIMGHKSNDITDDVYTHEILNEQFNEIQKISIIFA